MRSTQIINKDKTAIKSMFDSIAGKYDLLNNMLSFGMVKAWRKKFLQIISRYLDENNIYNPEILDIATGTGKVAFSLLKLNPKHITGIDLSENMLKIAKKKCAKKNINNITFYKGDAENINNNGKLFDIVSVCYGIRNFNNLNQVFSEVIRVLKPGGAFFIMEFSKRYPVILIPFIKFYMNIIVPLAGKLLAKNKNAYAYLSGSIDSFEQPDKIIKKLEISGFQKTASISYFFGMLSFYKGIKP